MAKEWQREKLSFPEMDVRKLKLNFLPKILLRAKKVEKGSGLCIIQSFEPKPLYPVLEKLGFEYISEKVSDDEYRSYFYKIK